MLFVQPLLAAFGFISAYLSLKLTYKKTARGVATCGRLQSTLGTTIVASSGTGYAAGISGAWNLFNTQYTPACIVFPREGSHVQAAMKTIYQNKIRYAVQAGGHSAMKGWNKYDVFVLFNANLLVIFY